MFTCSKCKLELDEFRRAGRRPECKACNLAVYRAWKAKNLDRLKTRMERYREKNGERISAQVAAYKENHREKVDTYNSEYRKEYRERINTWRSENRQGQPDPECLPGQEPGTHTCAEKRMAQKADEDRSGLCGQGRALVRSHE